MKATVSEKGQVTMPKALRDSLGIMPGEVLDFVEETGRLVARKVVRRDVIDELYGIIDLGRSTDEFMNDIRGKPGAV